MGAPILGDMIRSCGYDEGIEKASSAEPVGEFWLR